MTARSRSRAVTTLPPPPGAPRTARSPSLSAPEPARPAEDEAETAAMAPVQVSATVDSKVTAMTPSGFCGVWMNPGNTELSAVEELGVQPGVRGGEASEHGEHERHPGKTEKRRSKATPAARTPPRASVNRVQARIARVAFSRPRGAGPRRSRAALPRPTSCAAHHSPSARRS